MNVRKLLAAHPRAGHTFRLDFTAMLFTGAVMAGLQLVDVVGAKAYGAGAFSIAFIRSGMGAGMIASYFVARRVVRGPRVPYVTRPQVASRLLLAALVLLPWLPGGVVLPFFCVCAFLASALQHVTHPARLTLYRHVYPRDVRPLAVSRVRQAQMGALLVTGALLGLAMDWNARSPEGMGRRIAAFLPADLLPPDTFLRFGVPAVAALGLAGVFLFSRIREGARVRTQGEEGKGAPLPGVGEWIRTLRENRSFRVFEIAYFVFGFANLMTLPLLVILITKPRYGIRASYFEAMLLQTVIWQAAILVAAPFMGRLVRRYNPLLLRGVFTLFFTVDLVLMYVGYRTASLAPLYAGKAIRGVSMAGGMLVWELGPMYFAGNKERAPTFIGIHTVFTGIRGAIAPWAGAALAGFFSLGAAVLCGVALQAAAAALLIGYFLASKEERLVIRRLPAPEPGRAPEADA